MRLRRPHTYTESFSDFLVAFPLGQELHYFPLADTQPLSRFHSVAASLCPVKKIRKQNLGNAICEKWLMPGKRFNRIHEILVGLSFIDKALHASFENFSDQLVRGISGEDENLRLWEASFDLNRGIQAIQLRHRHVHDDDVWFERHGLVDGFTAGCGDPADFPARLPLDHGAGAFP